MLDTALGKTYNPHAGMSSHGPMAAGLIEIKIRAFNEMAHCKVLSMEPQMAEV